MLSLCVDLFRIKNGKIFIREGQDHEITKQIQPDWMLAR
jgi:hypothetical protein